jgi:hypothetical protein
MTRVADGYRFRDQQEVAMENKPLIINDEGYRCEEKCALEWVECVEKEGGAMICKTRERNCFGDCQW